MIIFRRGKRGASLGASINRRAGGDLCPCECLKKTRNSEGSTSKGGRPEESHLAGKGKDSIAERKKGGGARSNIEAWRKAGRGSSLGDVHVRAEGHAVRMGSLNSERFRTKRRG